MQAENVAVKKQEILNKCETLFKELSLLEKIANEIVNVNKVKTEHQIWLEATAFVDVNEIMKEKKYSGTTKMFFPLSMEQKNEAIDKQAQLLLSPVGAIRTYMKLVLKDINYQLYLIMHNELKLSSYYDIDWEILIYDIGSNLSNESYLTAIRSKVEEFIDLMLKNIK